MHMTRKSNAARHRVSARAALICLSLLFAGISSAATESATSITPPPFPDHQRVASLIADLGNTRYVARREAERQLLQIGLKAFDQIDAATSDPDPEVSASCRYLVGQLTRQWTRRDDPPKVKRWLSRYADYSQDQRISVVTQLGALADHLGMAALCRICRYDTSPVVSRQAAVELLGVSELEMDFPSDASVRLREAIGTSVRPAARWVRLLAFQLDSPRESIALWNDAIERNTKEVTGGTEEESLETQNVALLQNLVRLELRHGDRDGFLRTVARFVDPSAERFESDFWRLAEWVVDSDSPDLLDALFDSYESELASSKSGLYTAAMARAAQGRLDLAEKLADAALDHQPAKLSELPINESLQQAKRLSQEGHIEWARRELRLVVEKATVASLTHASACYLLADSLHDWELDEEAADTLDLITSALKSDAVARKLYNQAIQQNRDPRQSPPPYDTLVSYGHFYRSFDHLAKGDTEKQWTSLELAIKLKPEDVDIMIAMYRASADHPDRRKAVNDRIEKQLRSIEQEIAEQQIVNRGVYAQTWNEWAWLVSNTEGDFVKAVRYSQRSLEIAPGEAGLLDTLGCCYFAAGDLESAVKYQAEAVELSPHLRVLQRNLDRFEKALEESKQ